MSDAREMRRGVAIGVDAGGTKIAVGLVRLLDGAVLVRRETPARAERGGEASLADAIRLVEEVAGEARRLGEDPEFVGVGVPELVDRAGQIVSNTILGWERLGVAERISPGRTVRVESDVRAAALAEARVGAGAGWEEFLYVTVGTGISCAWVEAGRPKPGIRGLAGTCASSPCWVMDGEGRMVRTPTLEEVCSGPGLAAGMRRVEPDFAGTARDVARRAAEGDARAAAVVRSSARVLGSAVGQWVNTLDPEAVVVGGGLGVSGGLFWDVLVESVREQIWSDLARSLPVVRASTGVDAGVIGAALMAVAPAS